MDTKHKSTQKTDATANPKTRITKAAYADLQKKLEDAQYQLLMERGQAGSDALNRETAIRKLNAQLKDTTSRLTMEQQRSAAYAFAFGEFRCRELLWIASQWMRNAQFDLTINGQPFKRTDVLAEIDTFLKGFTFKAK